MNENNPLTSLPGEIIQDHLGPCLTGIEIIGLSETCRRLYRQFNVDSVWREKTRLEGLKISPQIERIAMKIIRRQTQRTVFQPLLSPNCSISWPE